eukprot:TRINITY_DN102882_c0_g1_i1.p1 TRINITY_DN102882_c0_g1~~TRINITY_DN102882_c0_g1_i1.p1  ORF type:complete len:550 (-),score=134.57 TRINITY_DN102882_c0_g1_i1:420-2069(-)
MSVHLVMKLTRPAAGGEAQFEVDIPTTATVLELKEQIAGRAGMPKENVRLVCAGRIWADTATVGSYEPSAGSIVHVLNNPQRAQPTAQEQVPQVANPMQQFLGGGSMVPAATGGDPMQQMMAQSQQMMMQNPEMMQQMMNSPMVQQMMSNPDTMRAIIRMNPQLNQLMEERPEIARLLEDPEMLQQSMRMAANPALMREMTRNADLAMGRLDAMPGGHHALVQAHQEFADPLFNALSGSNSAEVAENAAAYAQQNEGNPNNEALPNPWGAPAAAPAAAAASPATPALLAGATGNAAAGQNPMAAMMQQMMGGRGALGATPPAQAPAAGAFGTPAANPMANMMQQMMSNPAQMQQMMNLSQQLFGGAAGTAGTTPAAQIQPAAAAPAIPPANPMASIMQQMMNPAQQQIAASAPGAVATTTPAANPMAAMMQQMMSDPAQMQQMMAMTQQLMGGGGMPGAGTAGYAAPTAPTVPAANPMAAMMQQLMGGGFPGAPAAAPTDPAAQRLLYANQLSQLAAMGFTDEEACLRALVQHNGRVDATIDALLGAGN